MIKKKLSFDQYLSGQAKYSDSAYGKFFKTFSLSFILKNLDAKKKKEFIKLLKKEKYEKLFEFIAKNIDNFPGKLNTALKKEKERLRNNHERRSSNHNDQ